MFHKYTIYHFIETFNKEEINKLNNKNKFNFRNYSQYFNDPTFLENLLIFVKKENKKFLFLII